MSRARQMAGRLRLAGVGIILVLALAAIGHLSADVARRLEALSGAGTDNAPWTLSQLEIELLVLQGAMLGAAIDPAMPLADVRTRFDILFSRTQTLSEGARYAAITADPEAMAALNAILGWVDATAALIDGPDDALRRELPGLADALGALRLDARDVALKGTAASAQASDVERYAISDTLWRVAVLTVLLFVALAAVMAGLLRLFRRAERQAEQIRGTTARLEAMVSASIDAIIVVDERMRVLNFNGSAERIFGCRAADVLGRSAPGLLQRPASELAILFRDAQAVGVPPRPIVTRARRRSGEHFPVEVSVETIDATGGTLRVIFLRDISERVAYEEDLRQARDDALAGDRAKARFLAVMSHEMRTPLNGLIGTLDLLAQTDLDAEQARQLSIMQQSSQLLLDHVNDVLDLSKIESGRMELRAQPVDVAKILSDVVDAQMPLAGATGTLLELQVDSRVPALLGDERRIRQVLLNLVGNAVKFTRGGRVRAEIVSVGEAGGRHTVEVRVADTGIGIPEKDLDRIFDDFVTLDSSLERSAGGTGLGLGIARRMARLMEGDISVESMPGIGSTFTFRLTLPEAPRAVASPCTEERAAAFPPGPLDVLIVEDNEVNRFILRSMLKSAGYTIAEARDGIEGVEMAQARRFDVILTDVSMPRLDGIGACARIREEGASRDSLIVAVTAHAQADDINRFRTAKLDDWLLKPVRRASLAECLSRHLSGIERHGSARQARAV